MDKIAHRRRDSRKLAYIGGSEGLASPMSLRDPILQGCSYMGKMLVCLRFVAPFVCSQAKHFSLSSHAGGPAPLPATQRNGG